jgi:hypothetical protein
VSASKTASFQFHVLNERVNFTRIKRAIPVKVERAESARDEKDQNSEAAKPHWQPGAAGAAQIKSACQSGRFGRAIGRAGYSPRPFRDFPNRRSDSLRHGL